MQVVLLSGLELLWALLRAWKLAAMPEIVLVHLVLAIPAVALVAWVLADHLAGVALALMVPLLVHAPWAELQTCQAWFLTLVAEEAEDQLQVDLPCKIDKVGKACPEPYGPWAFDLKASGSESALEPVATSALETGHLVAASPHFEAEAFN